MEEQLGRLRRELQLLKDGLQEARYVHDVQAAEAEQEQLRQAAKLDAVCEASRQCALELEELRVRRREAKQRSVGMKFCTLALALRLQHVREEVAAKSTSLDGHKREANVSEVVRQRRSEVDGALELVKVELTGLLDCGPRWHEPQQIGSPANGVELHVEHELEQLHAQLLDQRIAQQSVSKMKRTELLCSLRQEVKVLHGQAIALGVTVASRPTRMSMCKVSASTAKGSPSVDYEALVQREGEPASTGAAPVVAAPPLPPRAQPKAKGGPRVPPPQGVFPKSKAKAKAAMTHAASSAVMAVDGASMGTADKAAGGRGRCLVNLNWRGSAAPKDNALLLPNDGFLRPIIDLLGSNQIQSPSVASSLDTVFAKCTEVFELQPPQLDFWFQLRRVPGDQGETIQSVKSSTAVGGTRGVGSPRLEGLTRRTVLDSHTLRSLGVLMQRFRMKRYAGRDVSADRVIEDMREAVLNSTLTLEELHALHRAFKAHREAGSPVIALVEQHGSDVLFTCEPASEHRLVHALAEIGALERRLQCMTFKMAWDENASKCFEDLKALHQGLTVISGKKRAVRKLFHTALRLGNILNKDGGAPVAFRGFRLGSLPKLLQLRSSTKPQLLLLHCILSLMDPVEVEILCSGLGILAVARDCKSSGVYERCLELVQGRSNVVRLSESVRAQQKSRCTSAREGTFLDLLEEEGQTSLDGELAGEAPGLAEEERIPLAADQDDLFPVFMHEFMVHSQREAHGIAQFCRDVFTTYWELAVYFEDPGAVYPPPQESDSVEDLFVVFHRLTEAVARAASEPESLRVREELLSHGAITFAPFDEAILGPDTSSTQHGTVTSSDRQLPNKSRPKLGGAGTAKPSKIREAATGSEVLTVQRRPEMIAETSTALKSIGPTQLSVYVETMPSDPSPCRRALRTSDGHDQDDFDAVTLQRLRNIAIPHNKDDHEQSDVSDWEQTPRRVEDCGCALAEDRLKNAGHRLRRRRLLPSPPPKSSVSSTPASCVLSTPALHSSLQGPSTPSSSAPTMPVCLGSPPMWQPLFSPPGRAIGANFGVFHTPITVSLGHHLAPLEITHSGLHISESTARNMDVQALPMVAPQPSGLSKGPITKSPSLNAKQPGEHSFVAISRHMDLRRSLSMAADRVESVVLLNMSDMALLSGPDPDDKGRVVARLRPHEPPVPFAAQLEAEVKRRSVSGHDVARS